MKLIQLINVTDVAQKEPKHGLTVHADLMIRKLNDDISVLCARCLQRGLMMCDVHIISQIRIWGVHGWNCRVNKGASEYNSEEVLQKFTTHVENGFVYVDEAEIKASELKIPPPFNGDNYAEYYANTQLEIAVPSGTLQATGFLEMTAFITANCPVKMATRQEGSRVRIKINTSTMQLKNFFWASIDLMKVIAKACGCEELMKFNKDDLVPFKRYIHH